MDSLTKAFQITGGGGMDKGRKISSGSSKGTLPDGPSIKVASGVKTENEVFKPSCVCRVRQVLIPPS